MADDDLARRRHTTLFGILLVLFLLTLGIDIGMVFGVLKAIGDFDIAVDPHAAVSGMVTSLLLLKGLWAAALALYWFKAIRPLYRDR